MVFIQARWVIVPIDTVHDHIRPIVFFLREGARIIAEYISFCISWSILYGV